MEPFWPKSQKSHFLLQNHFLDPKCILSPKCTFGAKSDFWLQSAILSKKCPLELSRTHIPPALFASGAGRTPKIDLCPQNHFLAPKRILGAKVHFGRKSALFLRKMHFCVPMARMLIKPMEFWWKWSPFWPKSDFGLKSALWAQKSILGPKMHFSAKIRFWAKRGSIFINIPLVL